MRFKFLHTFLLLCCFYRCISQKTDSLLSVLTTAKTDTSKINLLNTLGKELIIEEAFIKADSVNELAFQLSETLGFNSGKFNALTNSGVTFWYQGNYTKALDKYFKALRIAEEIKNKLFISRAHANIGLVYFSQKDFAKALDYDSQALKLKEQIGDKRAVAILISNIGQIYFETKDFENALLNYLKSLKLDEELENNKGLIALNYSNIANVHREKGNIEKAFEWYFKALPIAEEINDKPLLSTVSRNIGSLFTSEKKYAEAEKYLKNSLRISSEIGDLNNKKEVYLNLSQLYERTDRWNLSFENYKRFIETRDSVFNEANTKQTVKLEMNYEFEKIEAGTKAGQEKKDAILKKEKEKQAMIRNVFIAGFSLIIIIAIIIYRGYRNKQRANVIITKQKNEVEHSKAIIEHQKKEVEERQKEIIDSIRYAHRIQKALITNEKYIEKHLNRLNNT